LKAFSGIVAMSSRSMNLQTPTMTGVATLNPDLLSLILWLSLLQRSIKLR
jgi:hypothetical protein